MSDLIGALLELTVHMLGRATGDAVKSSSILTEPCRGCGGTGRLPEPYDNEMCPFCAGKGKVRRSDGDAVAGEHTQARSAQHPARRVMHDVHDSRDAKPAVQRGPSPGHLRLPGKTPMQKVCAAAIIIALPATVLSYTRAPALLIGLTDSEIWGHGEYLSLITGPVGLLTIAAFCFLLCLSCAGLGHIVERGFRGDRASGYWALAGAVLGGIAAIIAEVIMLILFVIALGYAIE